MNEKPNGKAKGFFVRLTERQHKLIRHLAAEQDWSLQKVINYLLNLGLEKAVPASPAASAAANNAE